MADGDAAAPAAVVDATAVAAVAGRRARMRRAAGGRPMTIAHRAVRRPGRPTARILAGDGLAAGEAREGAARARKGQGRAVKAEEMEGVEEVEEMEEVEVEGMSSFFCILILPYYLIIS